MSSRMQRRWIGLAGVVGLVLAAAPAAAQDAEASVEESAQATAPVAAGVEIAVGPMALVRSMQLNADGGTVTHEPGIYLGGALEGSYRLPDVDSIGAKVFLEIEGAYGATREAETNPEFNRPLVTETASGAARLVVRHPLSDAVDLGVGLGAAATSYVTEKNSVYTGHRYLAADFRLDLGWARPSSDFTLGAHADVLPVLALNQSSGGYGDGSAFGVRAGAEVGWRIFAEPSTDGYRGAEISLRYDYSRFRSQFPERRVRLEGGVSEDDAHALVVMFGYNL